MTGLPLLPRPRALTLGPSDHAFELDAHTEIVLGPDSAGATLFAARTLAAAIQAATGLDLRLRRAYDPSDGANRITLALAGRDPGPAADGLADLGHEGYTLTVEPGRVSVVATAEAGVFFGVQTLIQVVRTRGACLPALDVRDRPALAHRGVMLDVSRSKVPTLDTLFRLVDRLAAYKLNHLQLYTEHTFAFASHPDIGAGTDPLTPADMLALDAYCRARHVELVPNLQSFGHLRHLLSLPQYAPLDEVGWRWSVAPANEATYALFADLYADFLPAFSSGWLNVDADETWDLATGQSRARADRVGKGRVYLDHIVRLRELAARHGRRIMLWADVLLHYPDLLPDVPEDVILLDWSYENDERYPSVEALGRLGRPYWVCPGTSTWNTLFPRLDNALGNIEGYVRAGLAHGASGMLLTDWGDYGHYQPLSLSWYPYLFGAATAWTGASTSREDFDRTFATLFLGLPESTAVLAAMRRLGSAVTGPTIGLRNRSNAAFALFDEPLKGRLIGSASAAGLEELRAAAREASVSFTDIPDAELRHDYGFQARLTAFAADKVLLSQRVRALLRELPARADDAALAELDAAMADFQAIRDRLPALRTEFEVRWLSHARRSEIAFMLGHFDRLIARYDAAVEWLRGQRNAYADGRPLDATVTDYDPGEYRVLWEVGHVQLRRLAEVAGVEALAPEVQRILRESGALDASGGLAPPRGWD